MGFTFSIVLFFIALLAIILIHELGHYLTARAFGFRVLEYFVGFGPKLWSFRRGEIEYGLKAIPAGGYVKIAGMNPFENDVPPGDEDRAYGARPVGQRALVILAGPLSHFLVAAVIFVGLLFFVGDGHAARIDGVEPTLGVGPSQAQVVTSPAAVAGLQPGDLIIAIGGIQHPTQKQVGEAFSAHPGQPIPITVQRGDQTVSATVTPVLAMVDGEPHWRIGIQLGPVPRPLLSAIGGGFADVWQYTKVSVIQIGHAFGPQGVGRVFSLLFGGAQRQTNDVTSFVGVSQQVGAIGSTGNWAAFFFVFAYVTLFIGLVNLLPLPPFDGGHLAILLIEKLRGRKVDMRRVVPVSAAVLLFLGFFVVSTVVLDVWKPIPIGP